MVVASVVEGDGEVTCVPKLLHRILRQWLPERNLVSLPPIREPRGKMVKRDDWQRAIQLAHNKLRAKGATPTTGRILCLMDADEELPCELAPKQMALRPSLPVPYPCEVVVANSEYETWLISGAEGFADLLDTSALSRLPENVDAARLKKKWLETNLISSVYSPTVDQLPLTERFDLLAARRRSPSFDKLCRVVEGWKAPPPLS